MKCQWKELMAVLPPEIRSRVSGMENQPLQELRLRCGQPAELVMGDQCTYLPAPVNRQMLEYIINTASRYSPWASATLSQGYLTVRGGHRIGVCGETVVQEGLVQTFRTVHSVCIRIGRDLEGIAAEAAGESGSMLILGPPGWGKTTLLRDLVRCISNLGHQISVVDERLELFPEGFDRGSHTDVLSGCGKGTGILMVLRTMGPEYIAVDEITSVRDCHALLQAGWCGVKLLATAHASDIRDLRSRSVYRPLMEQNLFSTVLIMNRDKSWRKERLT